MTADTRAVLYAGEVLDCLTGGSAAWVTLSGFLFADTSGRTAVLGEVETKQLEVPHPLPSDWDPSWPAG